VLSTHVNPAVDSMLRTKPSISQSLDTLSLDATIAIIVVF
jgi:hypothetical protein